MTQPLNTAPEVMVEQARANLERNLPLFLEQPAHRYQACIVGGGPSLKDTLPALHRHAERGHVIVALNGTHDWLIERGILPDMHIMLDARAENAEFVRRPRRQITYLIAAQCHPSVFEALKEHEVIMWVADAPGMREGLAEVKKPLMFVGSGSTVGLKAMALLALWGFRSLHLFGMDSCYRDDTHHAYPQGLNDKEHVVDIIRCGRRFKGSLWMVAQAEDFYNDAQALMKKGVALKAYGSGLIQTLLAELQQQETVDAA